MTTRVAPATSETIEEAARILRRGGLVAFPTETVYGLGAIATNDRAVAAIFETKGRPSSNPLIVHVQDRAAATSLGVWSEKADALARAFWPGPLTLVLPRADGAPISHLATAGFPTIALRVPAEPTALALLAATLLPVAAPSANRSGMVSPTTAGHVLDGLGEAVDAILDGGPSRVGVESTVVDMAGPAPSILRPGGVGADEIAAVIGPLILPGEGASAAPGQLASHYAPAKPVRLNVLEPASGEAYVAFGPPPPQSPKFLFQLSRMGDLKEAARNLFAQLRAADASSAPSIAVAPIPDHGIGLAINDRLRRAAYRG